MLFLAYSILAASGWLTVVLVGAVAEAPVLRLDGIGAQNAPDHHNVRGVDRVHVAAGQDQIVGVTRRGKFPDRGGW